jgi:hypothetical protein
MGTFRQKDFPTDPSRSTSACLGCRSWTGRQPFGISPALIALNCRLRACNTTPSINISETRLRFATALIARVMYYRLWRLRGNATTTWGLALRWRRTLLGLGYTSLLKFPPSGCLKICAAAFPQLCRCCLPLDPPWSIISQPRAESIRLRECQVPYARFYHRTAAWTVPGLHGKGIAGPGGCNNARRAS